MIVRGGSPVFASVTLSSWRHVRPVPIALHRELRIRPQLLRYGDVLGRLKTTTETSAS